VAGTENGVTAIQMDIKVAGIDRNILSSALQQAKRGRAFILGKMLECIAKPNDDLSPYAPRVETMQIKVDKIRDVIGTGGKVVKGIIDATGVQIDIEDDGSCAVCGTDLDMIMKAIRIIETIVNDVEPGQVFTGKVVRIINIGAFVELAPGKDGMVHISKLSRKRVARVEDVVNVGDVVNVKVLEIDRMGRINLSMKDCEQP
jgi:polyribonucleotide nucleotidyltransferase